MTGETVAALVKQIPPSVGIAVRIGYVCGHQTRVTLATPDTPIPPKRLHCECGGRWRWVMEDAENYREGTTADGLRWQGWAPPDGFALVECEFGDTYPVDGVTFDVSPWLRTVMGWIFPEAGKVIMYGEPRVEGGGL